MTVRIGNRDHRGARCPTDGQSLAEYALGLAMIALVAVIGLIYLGGQISSALAVDLLPGRGFTPVVTPVPVKTFPSPMFIAIN